MTTKAIEDMFPSDEEIVEMGLLDYELERHERALNIEALLEGRPIYPSKEKKERNVRYEESNEVARDNGTVTYQNHE